MRIDLFLLQISLLLCLSQFGCSEQTDTRPSTRLTFSEETQEEPLPAVVIKEPYEELTLNKRMVLENAVPVIQEADGSFRLSSLLVNANQSELRLDDLDALRGWRNSEQVIGWRCKVVNPGYFTVYADYFCTGPTDEAILRIENKDQIAEKLLARTGDTNTFSEQRIGAIALKERGFHEVTVRMTGLPLAGDFGLRSIRLVPDVKPNSDFQFADPYTETPE